MTRRQLSSVSMLMMACLALWSPSAKAEGQPAKILQELPKGAIKGWGTLVSKHINSIMCVAVSRDGKFIASGDASGIIYIWNRDPFQMVRSFQAHKKGVTGIGFVDNDSNKLFSAGLDGQLISWDVAKKSALHSNDLKQPVRNVKFQADGKRVLVNTTVIGSLGPVQAMLVDATNLKKIKDVTSSDRWTISDLSHDGSTMAWLDSVGLVKWADVKTGQHQGQIELDLGRVVGLAFSPDGKRLFAWGRNRVGTWPLKDAKKLESVRVTSPPVRTGLAVSKDTIFLGTSRGMLRWSPGQKKVTSLKGNVGGTTALAVGHEGKLLYTGGRDRRVRVWNVRSGMSQATDGHIEGLEWSCMDWSPDGKFLYLGTDSGRVIQACWPEVSKQRILHQFDTTKLAAGIDQIHANADGSLWVSWGSFEWYQLRADAKNPTQLPWNVESNVASNQPLIHMSSGKTVAMPTTAKQWVVIGEDAEHENAELTLPTDAEGMMIPVPGKPEVVLFQKARMPINVDVTKPSTGRKDDSNYFTNRSVILYRQRALEAHVLPSPKMTMMQTVKASNLGLLVLRVDVKGVGHLFEFSSMASPTASINLGEGITQVAINQRSSLAAVGTKFGRIKIFNLSDGKRIDEFTGHLGPVTGLGFTASGESLVSTGVDGRVFQWAPNRQQAQNPGPTTDAIDANQAWKNLAGPVDEAWRAQEALVQHPKQAVEMLSKMVKPLSPADIDSKIKASLAKLDDKKFMTRRQGSMELAEWGGSADALLTKLLRDATLSAEVRTRIEEILSRRVPSPRVPSESQRQRARAVVVLYRIGTPDAVKHLKSIAEGSDVDWTTRLARRAHALLTIDRSGK